MRVFRDDVGTRNVGGHQIGRKLYTRKRQRKYSSERTHQTRFSYAGHAFQKNVAARNHRDDRSFHHFFLTDNVARYLSENIFALFAELLDVFLCNHFTFLFPLLFVF